MTVIARGAKARGALKRHNLTPNFQAEPPTTEGLVKLVEGTRCPGQESGRGPCRRPAQFRPGRGGRARRWPCRPIRTLPLPTAHKPERVRGLRSKRLRGDIGLVVFTTPPQVTILMGTAQRLGSGKKLIEVVNSSATIAAVGTGTAATLARHGVKVSVCPPEEDETMIGLVEAVETFLRKRAVRR